MEIVFIAVASCALFVLTLIGAALINFLACRARLLEAQTEWQKIGNRIEREKNGFSD